MEPDASYFTPHATLVEMSPDPQPGLDAQAAIFWAEVYRIADAEVQVRKITAGLVRRRFRATR